MLEIAITVVVILSGVLALAACALYPTKGEASKTVWGFKVRSFK